MRIELDVCRGLLAERSLGLDRELDLVQFNLGDRLGHGFDGRFGYWFGSRFRGNSGRRGLGNRRLNCLRHGLGRLGLRDLSRPAAQLNPHVLAASSGDDRKTIRDADGRRDIVLDRAKLGQCLLLIRRQDLAKHGRHRVERQHARRQLDLAPGERTAVGVHRR